MGAVKQDLRIRSGGGKGQGTAVAALHASLKSSLAQIQRENDAKRGKVGKFTDERLAAMGVDHDMEPINDNPIIDPKTGEVSYLPRPEDSALLVSLDHIPKKLKELKKQFNALVNDPETPNGTINQLQQQIQALESKRASIAEESAKISKKDVLDPRDISMLEKAAKLASKPAKCQRCHRIGSKQYQLADMNKQQTISPSDFVDLLKREFQREDAKSSIIIKVIDVLDFHGSMIQDLQKLTGPRNPIILAINKCDVLPREVNAHQVKAWAKLEAEKYGLHIHSIFPISAATGTGVSELMDKALLLARGNNDPSAPRNRNIYVMGTTNVGKSSLINQLLQKGVVGTGMPNDVTALARKSKHDHDANQKDPYGKRQEKENDGEMTNKDMSGLLDDHMNFLDTQALDDEMAEDLAAAKRADRAMKKALKNANGEDGDTGILFPKKEREVTHHDVLMSKHQTSRDPDINPVIADIDVAGVSKSTLDAIMPDKYLLEHQREIQLQEAISTTSPIPGTTLGIVSFPILEKKRGGRNLQIKDTPGVLNNWQLTSHLNFAELRRVLPTKRMAPLTYRVQPGQSIMLGALARVDMITGKPYQITNFVSSAVSVHIAASHRVDKEYLQQQIGVNLIPPFDPEANNRPEDLNIFNNLANVSKDECDALAALQHLSRLEGTIVKDRSKQAIVNKTEKADFAGGNTERFGERNVIENMADPKGGLDELAHRRKELRDQVSVALGQLAPVVSATTMCPSRVFIDQNGRFVVQLVGDGFKQASHDIVIAGLGWITVTGVGPLTLRLSLAGQASQLTQHDLDQIAIYHRERADSEEIFAETNIDDDAMNARNKAKNRIDPVVRQLLSRIVVRDPLFKNTAYKGDKWSGVPELVKKAMTPAMTKQRTAIMKRNEMIILHRQNPEIHPHPDEVAHQDEHDHPYASATDNYKNYTQDDLMNSNALLHSTKLHKLKEFEQELADEAKGAPRKNSLEAHKAQKRAQRDMAALYSAGQRTPDDFGSDFDGSDDDMFGSEDFGHDGDFDELAMAGQRPKHDILTGEFDAIPHPPVQHHSPAEEKHFKEKLAHKLQEKQLVDDWEFIQQFHQKKLQESVEKGDFTGTDGMPSKESVEEGMQKQRNDLSKLKQDLIAERPTLKQRKLLQDGKHDRALAKEFDYDDDFDGKKEDEFEDFDKANFKRGNFKIRDGDSDDDDEELITSMDQIYANMTDSEDSTSAAPSKGKKGVPKYQSEGEVDDESFGEYDQDGDSDVFLDTEDIEEADAHDAHAATRPGHSHTLSTRRTKQAQDYDSDDAEEYEAETSDVEYLNDIGEMATLEEMEELSDFDGIDYNSLRRQGRLDEYLAMENQKIDKRPVPTGPQGKRETGGRRAREAMGLVKENKFDELKRIQLQKEAKELHAAVRKGARQERIQERRAAETTKGNHGIVPKGAPNSESAGLMRTNQAYRFEEQNEAKRQRKLAAQEKSTRYGPNSDSEDDPRLYRKMANDVDSDDEIHVSAPPRRSGGGDFGGFKKSFDRRDDRPDRDGDFGGFKKSFDRGDGGFKKPFDRGEGGFKKPFDRGEGGFKKPFDRDGGFKKDFGSRDRPDRGDGGFKKPFDRGPRPDRGDGGFKKPFNGGGDRGDGGFRKPFDRGDRGGDFKKSYNGGDRGDNGGFKKSYNNGGDRGGFQNKNSFGGNRDRAAGGNSGGYDRNNSRARFYHSSALNAYLQNDTTGSTM
jgi:ribosome biogenesis GTPase A